VQAWDPGREGLGLISRRSFARGALLAPPLLLTAQPAAKSVLAVWSALRSVPEPLARESVIFPRAYAACPQVAAARRTLETGRFPHASRTGDPTLESLLRGAGWSYQLVAADSREEVERLAERAPANSILVFAGVPGGEDSPQERFIHVPFAIRWRGVLQPRSAPEILLSHADVLPTLLGLAGVPALEMVHGRNLAPVIGGERGELPDSVYIEGSAGASSGWRALVRGFDKLVFNLQEEVLGLYNIEDDPTESVNLARQAPQYPSVNLLRDGMLALAQVWMRKIEDGRDSSGARIR
jgi:arylsulfatase A-like enzyme